MPEKVQLLPRETYLAMIRNAVGSHQYRQCYGMINGEKIDLVQGGKTACGFFVTTLLFGFKLIKEPHLTVEGTKRELVESGWKLIKKPIPGCILFWELKKDKNGEHGHVGFYLESEKAVSTSSSKKCVAKHHWTYGTKNGEPKRKIIAIYGHPFLTQGS